MALINCKECNKEISDTAKTCPHCRASLKTFSDIKVSMPIVIVVIVAVIAVCLLIFTIINKSDSKSTDKLENTVYTDEVYQIALDLEDALNKYLEDDISLSTLQSRATKALREIDDKYDSDNYDEDLSKMRSKINVVYIAVAQFGDPIDEKVLEVRDEFVKFLQNIK